MKNEEAEEKVCPFMSNVRTHHCIRKLCMFWVFDDNYPDKSFKGHCVLRER